jgi:hypothetical protein
MTSHVYAAYKSTIICHVSLLCYSDMERKQKVKEILGSAAMQQGELRKLKRKK